MSRKSFLIIVFIAVAALAVYLLVKLTFRESEKSVASEPAVATLNAPQLLQLFEENEDSANRLYLGKVIQVQGVIDSFIEDSVSVSVYLKDAEAFTGIMCVFDKTVLDATSLQQGAEISIKGMCSGYLFDVILNKCALVE